MTTDVHEPRQWRRSPRWSTSCRSPRSSAGRPTCSWPRAQRPRGQRQEGPVHGPVGHEERGRKVRRRQPNLLLTSGAQVRLQQPVVDFRGLPIMRSSAARWCSTPPTRCSCRAGQGDRSGGEPSSSRCSRARRSRPGWTGVLEVHDNPTRAKSDGANALDLKHLRQVLSSLVSVQKAAAGKRER